MSIAKAIEAARKRAREVQENCHYDGSMTVTVWGKVKDADTGITSMQETATDIVDAPCHVSFETTAQASQTDSAASVSTVIKLFTSPDLEIPAGSKITVTQAGKTTAYKCSGEPAIYDTHQEVNLILFDGWA